MKGLRITKYDPASRDSEGRYLKQTWTSISDIGHWFDGKVLTVEDYLHVEQLYVDTVIKLANILGVNAFRICSLEKSEEYIESGDWSSIHSKEMRRVFDKIMEGLYVPLNDIEHVCKLVLREQLWCKLENDKMLIHFGYDYYMYIAYQHNDSEFVRKTIPAELYVEQMESPYMETEAQ